MYPDDLAGPCTVLNPDLGSIYSGAPDALENGRCFLSNEEKKFLLQETLQFGHKQIEISERKIGIAYTV